MSRIVKRCIDILVAALVLLLFAPLLACVALVLRLQMGSPVFFRQVRPGYRAQPFTLLKFRTMNSARDEQGSLLPDEERLTKLGAFLRRYSVDELPQLWNVLKGEMSLVGPRPLLMQYLARYTPEQMRRHEVKPGITGWVQINGRNTLTWDRKFQLDLWYVDHHSLWVDARILARTFSRVLKREGISQHAHATMPEFMGPSQDMVSRLEEP
jgi:lipopolysaccharide/colanic/teichoic acid biosynthesis glycosyltransferase